MAILYLSTPITAWLPAVAVSLRNWFASSSLARLVFGLDLDDFHFSGDAFLIHDLA